MAITLHDFNMVPEEIFDIPWVRVDEKVRDALFLYFSQNIPVKLRCRSEIFNIVLVC